jgi:hypothetical protein
MFLSRTSRNCHGWKLKKLLVHHIQITKLDTIATSAVLFKSGGIVLTDLKTDRHQIFYCFIVFRDPNNVHKSHKNGGVKFFIIIIRVVLQRLFGSDQHEQTYVPICAWSLISALVWGCEHNCSILFL